MEQRKGIPFDQRTPEERKESARKGGIASGVVRRRNRDARAAARLIAGMGLESESEIRQYMMKHGIDPSNFNVLTAMYFSIARRAIEEFDIKATRLFMKLIEEDPKSRIRREKYRLKRLKYQYRHGLLKPEKDTEEITSKILILQDLLKDPDETAEMPSEDREKPDSGAIKDPE